MWDESCLYNTEFPFYTETALEIRSPPIGELSVIVNGRVSRADCRFDLGTPSSVRADFLWIPVRRLGTVNECKGPDRLCNKSASPSNGVILVLDVVFLFLAV